jgi:DNA polymerase
MRLAYQDLQILGSQYKYSFRGKPEFTWGGKITENIVQALSRIVITDGLLRIHAYLQDLGGAVVLTVHDEIVCIAPETDATTVMDKIIELMCIPPSWAPDLPLAAEGGFDKAYSK